MQINLACCSPQGKNLAESDAFTATSHFPMERVGNFKP